MLTETNYIEIAQVALGGSFGAFIKDCLQDNAIELPYKKDGKIYLGFVGGALVGALVGTVIDGSFITALMAGYTGTSVLRQLLIRTTDTVRTINKIDKDELNQRRVNDGDTQEKNISNVSKTKAVK